jgi:TRAP-type C4-dicarboxylate transport system permease small subunit
MEHALLVVLLLVLVGVGAGQAIATKLGSSWAWSFEIIRYSVFFIAMTGAALSAHTGQLIAMDFVTRMISPQNRARLRVVLRLFTIAICVLLVVGGKMLVSAATDTLYHVINPRWGLMALPIGAGLIAVHVLLHMAIDLIYLLRGRTPPEGAVSRSAH